MRSESPLNQAELEKFPTTAYWQEPVLDCSRLARRTASIVVMVLLVAMQLVEKLQLGKQLAMRKRKVCSAAMVRARLMAQALLPASPERQGLGSVPGSRPGAV